MTGSPDDQFEERLREILRSEVEHLAPAPEALERIRERTRKRRFQWLGLEWLRPAAAVAAAVLIVGSVLATTPQVRDQVFHSANDTAADPRPVVSPPESTSEVPERGGIDSPADPPAADPETAERPADLPEEDTDPSETASSERSMEMACATEAPPSPSSDSSAAERSESCSPSEDVSDPSQKPSPDDDDTSSPAPTPSEGADPSGEAPSEDRESRSSPESSTE